MLRIAQGRCHNDVDAVGTADAMRVFKLANRRQRFVTIGARHHDVQADQVEWLMILQGQSDRIDRFLAVIGERAVSVL